MCPSSESLRVDIQAHGLVAGEYHAVWGLDALVKQVRVPEVAACGVKFILEIWTIIFYSVSWKDILKETAIGISTTKGGVWDSAIMIHGRQIYDLFVPG